LLHARYSSASKGRLKFLEKAEQLDELKFCFRTYD
jgi:hypothetical protein